MMKDQEEISGKRTVKMTEKAMAEQASKHVQARRHKLSQLTCMMKEIEKLMEDDANVGIVNNKMRVSFSGLQQELSQLNAELGRFMSEEDYENDQKNLFEPKIRSLNEFFWKCEEWMKEVTKRSEQAEECDKQIKPMDSVSGSVRTKSSSGSGSTHSVRLKTELERAALQAKAAALKAKLDIEQEEADWLAQKRCREAQLQAEEMRFEAEQKRRKEIHAMETALAESDAKMGVLEKYEYISMDRNVINIEKAEEIKENMHFKPLYQYASPQPHRVKHDVQPQATPATTSTLKAPKGEANDGLDLDSLSRAISQQANVTEYLVKNHKASLLPDLTIPTFTGNPLEYKTFIRSIEHGIEDRTSDNRDRLQFLLQYTSGQPHDLVKSCIHMEPTAGYTKAKQMLKQFFGDDFKIAEAYIKEALEWQTIKPEDGAALQSFALFLTGCSNTMTDISYMEDLENASNLRALANKLPYKLKETWRKHTCDLQDKTNQRACHSLSQPAPASPYPLHSACHSHSIISSSSSPVFPSCSLFPITNHHSTKSPLSHAFTARLFSVLNLALQRYPTCIS